MIGHNTMGTTPMEVFASVPAVTQAASGLLMPALYRLLTDDHGIVLALDETTGPQDIRMRVSVMDTPQQLETWSCRLIELDDHGRLVLWLESDRADDGTYVVCRLDTFGKWVAVQSVAVKAAFDVHSPVDRADALEALATPLPSVSDDDR